MSDIFESKLSQEFNINRDNYYKKLLNIVLENITGIDILKASVYTDFSELYSKISCPKERTYFKNIFLNCFKYKKFNPKEIYDLITYFYRKNAVFDNQFFTDCARETSVYIESSRKEKDLGHYINHDI